MTGCRSRKRTRSTVGVLRAEKLSNIWYYFGSSSFVVLVKIVDWHLVDDELRPNREGHSPQLNTSCVM